jgi:hypothetical protein
MCLYYCSCYLFFIMRCLFDYYNFVIRLRDWVSLFVSYMILHVNYKIFCYFYFALVLLFELLLLLLLLFRLFILFLLFKKIVKLLLLENDYLVLIYDCKNICDLLSVRDCLDFILAGDVIIRLWFLEYFFK